MHDPRALRRVLTTLTAGPLTRNEILSAGGDRQITWMAMQALQTAGVIRVDDEQRWHIVNWDHHSPELERAGILFVAARHGKVRVSRPA